MNKTNALHNVYMLELSLLLSREKQLVAALPKMAKMAADDDLKDAINQHLEETKKHRDRLEDILDTHGVDTGDTCGTMQTLLAEAEGMVESVTENGDVKDAVIIAGAQKVEHFEKASYQTVIQWADVMGHEDDKATLNETLAEENAASDKLATIAQGGLLSEGLNEETVE